LFVVADRIICQGKFHFRLKSCTPRHTLISPSCTKRFRAS
jgi:hypothetical protein